MTIFRRALCAATTLALACAALPPVTLAGVSTGGTGPAATGSGAPETGATRVLSATRAGGAEYGALAGTSPGPAPVVSVFEVPSTVVAGKPPRVRVRVDSPHAGTVHVKVILFQSSAREALISINLGWVRTARTITVRWPRGTRLQEGTYELAVGVHGHRVGPAHAFAHASRSARLTVTAIATPPGSIEALPPGVPTPARSAALGAVFPVAGVHSFGGPENRFGAPRGNHVHQGQDVLTDEGTPIVAPLAGTVITTGNQPSAAGYYVAEHTAVGLDFFFAHCKAGSLLVKENEPVAAGQQLCAAGQTGDATAPHLHFEIWIGGWQAHGGYPIDPLPYLEAWEQARG
jgi:biotin carboxyl carrier protein